MPQTTKTAPSLQISRLERPIYSGDWHDRPLKWTVEGPAAEVQHFCTKADAMLYRKCRRETATFAEASKMFQERA